MIFNTVLAKELGIQGPQSQRIRKRTVKRRNAMDLSNCCSTLNSSSSTSKEGTVVVDKNIAKKHASTRSICCPRGDFFTSSSSTEELNYDNEAVTNILIGSHNSLLLVGEGKEEGKEASYSSWRRLGILHHHQDKSQRSILSKPIKASPARGSFRRTLSGLWDSKCDDDSCQDDAAEEAKIREEIYNKFRTRINSNIYKHARRGNNYYDEDGDNFLLYES
jgi:hypothetical protein